jgi:hypothetical protein
MDNLSRFKQATWVTRECFNKWGASDIDAILECRIADASYAPYDLTILVGDPSSVHGKHYRIATGSHVYGWIFKSKAKAADALVAQYYAIRRPMAQVAA